MTTLHKQIHELNELTVTLKLEMEVYDRLVRQLGIDKNKPVTPGILFRWLKDLRPIP